MIAAVEHAADRPPSTKPPAAPKPSVIRFTGPMAIGMAAVLLVALWPFLAIVIVWPLLFFLPGWWLTARVAPTLSPAGRAGVAVVGSTLLSTHLVYLVSAATSGFSAARILIAAALLLAATWLLATQDLPWLAPPPRLDWSQAAAALRQYRVAWAIGGLAVLAVGGVLRLSAWHQTADGWVSGGWNWSDFLVHVSIASSIQHGNFPPQVPYFAGRPLTYHWFADFQAAIAATSAQVDLVSVMALANAIMAGALAVLIWELTMVLTRNRTAAGIATLLGLFTGGLGYIRLPLDVMSGKGSAFQLVSQHPYDNGWLTQWPYFRIASVFGTGLLNQRATAFGLPAVVAVVLLVHESWGRFPAGVFAGGLLAALLAPFDFFAFPAVYLIAGIQLLTRKAWKDPLAWRDALLFFAPIVLMLPLIVGVALQQHSRGAVKLVAGWPDAPLRDGPLAVAFFYLTNLGVPFVLALVAAAWSKLPARGFLLGWLVALFLVPNILVVSAVTFDMNRYFQIMWIAVAIAAGWLIRGWPRPAVVGVLIASMLSPALIGIWYVQSNSLVLTDDQERAARWIASDTPDRSVFVTDAFINSPVDLAGRLRLTSYGPYVANLGYDPAPREAAVHHVYCDGDQAAAAIMRRYGANYVVSSGGLLDCGGRTATQFAASPIFETAYRNATVSVWRLQLP